jgi:N-alpha-acetyltransferase 15/16, NatA auxiliary subunit
MHDKPALKQSKPVAGKEGPLAAIKEAQAHANSQANGVANGAPAVADSSKKSNKAKKAEARAAAAEAAKKAAAEAEKKSKKDDEDEMAQPPKDEDPEGVRQLAELQPLQLASFICRSLQENAPEKIETWLATFEWAIRESEWKLLHRDMQTR